MSNKISSRLNILYVIGVSLLLVGCGGTNKLQIQEMLVNLSSSITPFWRLVTGASYLFGLVFVFRGIFMLKVYGEGRTMMSGQANLKGALICLLVGAVLLFSQSMYDTLLFSTFSATSTSPLQYDTNSTLSIDAYFSLLRFISLIGLISFIRGWVMLTHLSNPGQQSSFGKALTHIIGGLLAINIQGTINVVQGTLGMS